MANVPRLLFALCLVVAPAIVWGTSAALPQRVATHFGHSGLANGWMTQDRYLAFMLAMTILFPLVVVLATGLPRLASFNGMLRDREYWLAPSRRAATLSWLAGGACALGILLVAFLVAIHLLILEANARTPARLDESAFWVVLASFLALMAIGIGAIAWRFRKRT